MGLEQAVESGVTRKLGHSIGMINVCFIQHCDNYRTLTEATNPDQ